MKILWIPMLTLANLLVHKCSCVEIISGTRVQGHLRPYMALIQTRNGNYVTTCGGTLIHKDWVVTAAHCKLNVTGTSIQLGVLSIQNAAGVQTFGVTDLFNHPDYNEITNEYDIQIVKLNRSAILTPSVEVLNLPQSFIDIPSGTQCQTAGWGRQANCDRHISNDLMEVTVAILDRINCNDIYRPRNITNNMLCTAVGPNREGPCKGDSGGPLLCNGMFRGIVSFGGPACGCLRDADVYTFLTHGIDNWVRGVTGIP